MQSISLPVIRKILEKFTGTALESLSKAYWRDQIICVKSQAQHSSKPSTGIKFGIKNIYDLLKLFQVDVPFIHPLKTSENPRFSDVFRGYRKVTLAWNGLIILQVTKILSSHSSRGNSSQITTWVIKIRAFRIDFKRELYLTWWRRKDLETVEKETNSRLTFAGEKKLVLWRC